MKTLIIIATVAVLTACTSKNVESCANNLESQGYSHEAAIDACEDQELDSQMMRGE